jgi:uncharacterized protein YozE (UPF0346 family)
MGTKKKKSGKPKTRPQFKGHYCKICGEHKANEKFSGKGHAAHICKVCASKSPAEQSEDMTINRLHGMAFRRLSGTEMEWLKNRRNDSRPEVRELAGQVFEERFPRQARNEIKAQLHIQNMVFHIRGEVFDNCGDEYTANAEFTANTSGLIVKKTYDGNEALVEEKSVGIGAKAIRKFFNVAVHNYDIPFWDIDLCREISFDPELDLLPEYRYGDDFDFDEPEDDEFAGNEGAEQTNGDGGEPHDRTPTWSVEIKYKNGTEQKTKGYDFIPDRVLELFDGFNGYFEEDILDDGFDEGDTEDND